MSSTTQEKRVSEVVNARVNTAAGRVTNTGGRRCSMTAVDSLTTIIVPRVMTMSERVIDVCPECMGSNVRNRTCKPNGRAGQGAYYCQDCRSGFDEPAQRKTIKYGGLRGLSARLAEMDPDEVPGL